MSLGELNSGLRGIPKHPPPPPTTGEVSYRAPRSTPGLLPAGGRPLWLEPRGQGPRRGPEPCSPRRPLGANNSTAGPPAAPAHPVRVFGFVGDGLWLHDGGAAAAPAGPGGRDAAGGNPGKPVDTLALSGSRASPLFLTCGRRAWGPPCWGRGGAWEGHVGGRRARSRRALAGPGRRGRRLGG